MKTASKSTPTTASSTRLTTTTTAVTTTTTSASASGQWCRCGACKQLVLPAATGVEKMCCMDECFTHTNFQDSDFVTLRIVF